MNPLPIRRATVADAGAISGLLSALAPALAARPEVQGLTDSFLADFAEPRVRAHVAAERFQWFVACAPDGRLAGVAALRDGSHVHSLFVAPEFQRRGLARRLWAGMREAAAAAGAGDTFTVNAAMTAVPVYERFGFVPAGTRTERDGVAYLPMCWRAGRDEGASA